MSNWVGDKRVGNSLWSLKKKMDIAYYVLGMSVYSQLFCQVTRTEVG